MPITALEYAKLVDKNQAVEGDTASGMAVALADAAQKWGALKPEEKNAKKAKELIQQAALATDNKYLQSAGTSEIAAAYAANLVTRSENLDNDPKTRLASGKTHIE